MLDSLTDAQKFALTGLLEVTPVSTVGEFVGESSEAEYVTTYRFATTLAGYPGWNWTITIADLPDEHPTIIESELMPADGALLAPDWVPWSERLEEYKAAQAALGETVSLEGESDDDGLDGDDDDDDDDEDDEDDDEDALGSDTLHGGDLDGVDIDELDPAVVEDDEPEDVEPEPVAPPKERRSRRVTKPQGE